MAAGGQGARAGLGRDDSGGTRGASGRTPPSWRRRRRWSRRRRRARRAGEMRGWRPCRRGSGCPTCGEARGGAFGSGSGHDRGQCAADLGGSRRALPRSCVNRADVTAAAPAARPPAHCAPRTHLKLVGLIASSAAPLGWTSCVNRVDATPRACITHALRDRERLGRAARDLGEANKLCCGPRRQRHWTRAVLRPAVLTRRQAELGRVHARWGLIRVR